MMAVKRFKSVSSYRKWLAYGHIHGDFKNTKGVQKVYVAGRLRKVRH